MPATGRTQTGSVSQLLRLFHRLTLLGKNSIPTSLDCQWYNGCGVKTDSEISYGPAFNNNGGGWYAVFSYLCSYAMLSRDNCGTGSR